DRRRGKPRRIALAHRDAGPGRRRRGAREGARRRRPDPAGGRRGRVPGRRRAARGRGCGAEGRRRPGPSGARRRRRPRAVVLRPDQRGGREMNERPSLARLTKVELRKMVDTRSGFWLQVAVLGLIALTVVVTLLAVHEDDHPFRHILSNALQPAGILLPVVGILLVTSEWSQRTALVSFALVPHRTRLFAAKVLAGAVLGMIALAFAAAVAALGTAVASPDIAHVWTFPVGLVGQDLLYAVSAMAI